MSDYCVEVIFNMVGGMVRLMDYLQVMNCRCMNLSLSLGLLLFAKLISTRCLYKMLFFRLLLRFVIFVSFILAIERQTYLHDAILLDRTLKAGLKLVVLYLVRYFLLQSYIRDKQAVDRCIVKKEDKNKPSAAITADTQECPPEAGVPAPAMYYRRSSIFRPPETKRNRETRRSPLDFSFDLSNFLENKETSRFEEMPTTQSKSRLFCCPEKEDKPIGLYKPEEVEEAYQNFQSAGFLSLALTCTREYLNYLYKCLMVNFTLDENAASEIVIPTPACDVFCSKYGYVMLCIKMLMVKNLTIAFLVNYYMLKTESTITLSPISADDARLWLKCLYDQTYKTLSKCLKNFCTPRSKIPVDIALAAGLKAADSYRRSSYKSKNDKEDDKDDDEGWRFGGFRRKSVQSKNTKDDDQCQGPDGEID